MLVLSRKAADAIVITGGIRITVQSIDANRVTLGIEAPPDIEIIREELLPAGYDPTLHNHQHITRRARQQQLRNRDMNT